MATNDSWKSLVMPVLRSKWVWKKRHSGRQLQRHVWITRDVWKQNDPTWLCEMYEDFRRNQHTFTLCLFLALNESAWKSKFFRIFEKKKLFFQSLEKKTQTWKNHLFKDPEKSTFPREICQTLGKSNISRSWKTLIFIRALFIQRINPKTSAKSHDI